MIPGFFIPGAAGQAKGVLESMTVLSQVIFEGSSGSDVLTYPVGILAGDVLAMLLDVVGDQNLSHMGNGWVNMGDLNSSDGIGFQANYKLCDGTESGTEAFDADSLNTYGLWHLRGNIPTVGVTGQTLQRSYSASGNPGAITLTTGAMLAPAMAFAMGGSNNANVESLALSPVADATVQSAGTFTQIAYKRYNLGASMTDTTADLDDEGFNNRVLGFALAFTGPA